MDPDLARNLVIAGIVLAVSVCGLVWLLPTLWQHFAGSRGGSWRALAERFPASGPPTEKLSERQSVQVGQVTFKRCVTVGIGPKGLYLARKPLFPWNSPPPAIFIPWSNLHCQQQVKLFWQQAEILAVCSPAIATITILDDLFQTMRGYVGNENRGRSKTTS